MLRYLLELLMTAILLFAAWGCLLGAIGFFSAGEYLDAAACMVTVGFMARHAFSLPKLRLF